jgi:tyrosinase
MRPEIHTEYRTENRTGHNDTTGMNFSWNETIPYNITRMVRDPNPPSRNDAVGRNLDNNRKNLQMRVYNMLAFEHDYLPISSEVQGPNNIESIHGTIHSTVGGEEGNFYIVYYSAFDPIFWLHHGNVDRLFSIWEALNPNYTVPSFSNAAQTFTMPANVATDGNTRKSFCPSPLPRPS